MLAAMAFSSISFANANVDAEQWRVNADNCWNRTATDYTDTRVWEKADGSLLLILSKMSFGKKGQAKCSMTITVPVKSENESCEGINSIGFAIDGRKSFAAGNIRSEGTTSIAQIFSHYSGNALGLAVLGGVGHWESTTNRGVHIEDKIVAIPMPMMGGNLAVGYTSCRIKFDLAPASTEAEIDISDDAIRTKKSIPLEQILNLSI